MLKAKFKKTKIMASDSRREILERKVDSCAKCGNVVMANLVLYTKCGKRLGSRCVTIRRVFSKYSVEKRLYIEVVEGRYGWRWKTTCCCYLTVSGRPWSPRSPAATQDLVQKS